MGDAMRPSPNMTATPTDVGEDAVQKTMARVRTALDASERHLDSGQEALFEYVAAQMARYASLRDNPYVNVNNHIGNYWRNWLLVIVQTGPYRPSALRRLLTAL